jgi:integrase
MIDIGIKLDKDVNDFVFELGLSNVSQENMYQQFVNSYEVGEARLQKIQRVLEVVKVLLPTDFSKIDMQLLADVRNKILHLPKRNLAKYKDLALHKIASMHVPKEDRLTATTVKDYIVVLNAFLKFLYEMDIINRHYSIKNVIKTTDNRDDRVSLSSDTILKAVKGAKTAKLASSFILLYLTGMRPSEAHLCNITTIDGIKCFDLTDKSIKLKTNASRRVIPVHKSIADPEKMLEDYRSMKPRMISRDFSKNVDEGTLYSLRHSFATELASKGVEPHIISELLGHSHSGMTMGRYVKGLPVKILKHAVDNLRV